MATEAANAERQARAQNTINGHVERIARSIGVAAPPPVSKADGKPAQQANEAERMALFLEMVANHVDPSNAGKTYAAAAAGGGIGEYNFLEEQAKASKKGGKGATAEAVDEVEADDASPVSEQNADEAIAQIERMRSRDKLQHIADNDTRVSVKKAAQDRLASL